MENWKDVVCVLLLLFAELALVVGGLALIDNCTSDVPAQRGAP